jgi:hypothetical protein
LGKEEKDEGIVPLTKGNRLRVKNWSCVQLAITASGIVPERLEEAVKRLYAEPNIEKVNKLRSIPSSIGSVPEMNFGSIKVCRFDALPMERGIIPEMKVEPKSR